MFLYLLPSAQHSFFKIGVSETHQRIFYLDSIYAFDIRYAFAIEMENAELVKSIENYLLKLTAENQCKTFYRRKGYAGKTFPGRTELRDWEALGHVVVSLCRFIEYHSADIKIARFFYHTCPHCDAPHQKYEYVELNEIPYLHAKNERLEEYYRIQYSRTEKESQKNVLESKEKK